MMGSRAWQATVHRVAKYQMSEATKHTCIWGVDPGTSSGPRRAQDFNLFDCSMPDALSQW